MKRQTHPQENAHVKEFMSILRDNNRDTTDFAALLGYVTAVENQLNSAVGELQAMRRELAGMREERDHPVRTALQNASKNLEAKINETRETLDYLKEKIVEGCKKRHVRV